MMEGIISWPPVELHKSDIVITSYQAKVALADFSLYDVVVAAIYDANTPVRIRLAWESGLDLRRDNPMILMLVSQLGLTDEQVDALFAHAQTINPGEL